MKAMFNLSSLVTAGVLAVSVSSVFAAETAAKGLPSQKEVVDAMASANNFFMKKWPEAGSKDALPGKRPTNIWTRGVYFEGAMALYKINKDPAIQKYAVDWGNFHNWDYRKGYTTTNPDDQCAGQTYIDLYQFDTSKPERLKTVRENLDFWTKSDKIDNFTWVDTFQMSMPIFATMGVMDNKPEYFEKMHVLYSHAKNDLGLYNAADKLWWRDVHFKPPFTTPNGKQCYWSRGNGWVVAALVRVLDVLPPTHPHYQEYLQMLKDMSSALVPLQREDGFWNASLADPKDFGGPETTGTSLFIYGMAWGVKKGYLPAETYVPVIAKGWNAIIKTSLHDNGFLGYVQGTGDKPSDGQPVTFDSVPDFDDYGVGCFLLAGSEIHSLVGSDKAPKK